MTIQTSGPRPSDRWIPWMIIGFFISLVLVLVPMCIIAVRTSTGVITDHAYEKGLAYNKSLAANQQQQALNWRGDLTFKSYPNDREIELEFHLTDVKGRGLDSATIIVLLVRPTQDGMDRKITLQPSGSGLYHAKVAIPASGLWDANVSATLRGQNFQMVKRIMIP